MTAPGSPEDGQGYEFPPLEKPGAPTYGGPVDYPTGPPPMPPGYAPPGYPNPPAYPGPGPYAYGYPPGYGPHPYDPYDPYRATLPGTNTKAIAALVTSLAGLIFCGLPSIAGIILGIMAIRETKRTGQDGFGMAVAATVIGSAIVALILAYILFVVVIAMSSSTPYVS